MSRRVAVAFVSLLAGSMLSGAAHAADLSQQEPIEIKVQLGSKAGDLKFTPNALTFEAGKLYKLVLNNPSNTKHYFSALRFAAGVWSRKVEAGQAEIKGTVREIEVKPGGTAEWFFVPVQAGAYALECTVPGHAQAGMVGQLTVE